MTCPKCGSEDINTTFHPATDCTKCNDCHEYLSLTKRCPGGTEEHLHRHCRGCQFSWNDPTLEQVGA